MSFTVVYTTQTPPEVFSKSLFLAGPSPRELGHLNWRPEAIKILEELGYDGVVFVPLPEDGNWPADYDVQVEWEKRYLDMADAVVFWVSRDMETLPALTTNVEFGMYFDTGKAFLGFPEQAVHMKYLEHHGQNEGVPIFHDLRETLQAAIDYIGDGAERTGGEREVPLKVWQLDSFQTWIKAQQAAGNRLDGAKVLWTFRLGPKKDSIFAYAVHVNVYVSKEGRNKINEIIISRPDVATVVIYCRPNDSDMDKILDTKIAIIREFRSPASIDDCFVREIPGGSSWKRKEDFSTMALQELQEETGFTLEASRLKPLGVRQMADTFSTHQAHVFSCEVTPDEMSYFQKQAGVVHGVAEDSEQTYVEVYTVRELLEKPLVDWANLGMILSVLL